MNRRNFLKFASVGALAAGTTVSGTALAAAERMILATERHAVPDGLPAALAAS